MKRCYEKEENHIKKVRYILIAVLILFVVAGYNSVDRKETASAATTYTIKADFDFTLKIPSSWKGNYVIEKSKNKKNGSYVGFHSKKCHDQTGEGWLFSIMRYKDDSYTDMPSYELVGKWNGYNYVAVYSTDVQYLGATKAAKQQYMKMIGSVEAVSASIKPVKKEQKTKGLYIASDFTLKLPDNWKSNYTVKRTKSKKNGSYVAFYSKKCYEKTKEGFLFSITRYKDESYTELPSYELVGIWNGYHYVAVYPTDVQSLGAGKAAEKQYSKLNKSTEKVAKSIRPR